ncbi:hypothetical protein GV818_07595 [Pseudomonas sp. Fl4BN1]|nr:hypothetical protein [Pseudomonas sp. Fl4BN1]
MQSIDHVVYLNMFLRGFLIRVETNVLQRTGTRTGISAATRANLKKARWGNGESNVKKTNGIAPACFTPDSKRSGYEFEKSVTRQAMGE